MGRSPDVRLIATDIDGTMLRSDGSLSDPVRNALHEAWNRGVHVVPATGRPLVVSFDVIDALGLYGYWVFANGAVTRHLGRDEMVRGYWIHPAVAQGLVVELRAALEGARFAIEMERDVAYEPGFEDLVPMKPSEPPIADVLDGITHRVQKVLVFHEEHDLDTLFDEVGRVVAGHAVPSYSGLPFVEVAPALVTKATALAELAADLGVDVSEVAAFGDNHNDVPMLEWAGRSFAMGNASDDAKAAADAVIGDNDADALAEAIGSLLS